MLTQPLTYFTDMAQKAANVLGKTPDFDLQAAHDVMYGLVIGLMLTESGVPAHILERLEKVAALATQSDPEGEEDAIMASLMRLSSEDWRLLARELDTLRIQLEVLGA